MYKYKLCVIGDPYHIDKPQYLLVDYKLFTVKLTTGGGLLILIFHYSLYTQRINHCNIQALVISEPPPNTAVSTDEEEVRTWRDSVGVWAMLAGCYAIWDTVYYVCVDYIDVN